MQLNRYALLLLAGATPILAQNPGLPPGLNPNNRPQPGESAAPGELTVDMAPPPGPVDPETVINEDIIQAKLNGDDLAELYRRFTGRRVTVSPEAAAAEFRFIQRAPMTYREASLLLKKAALLSGFVFVPDPNPGLENHDVLVTAAGGVNAKGEGVEVVLDPMDLPEDDRVVSYVMNLKVIKPDEIQRVFTTIVGQFGAYGSITPIPNAGAVVITEKTSLIRRLIELQKEIDVSSTVATRFISVQYADVTELAETLNEILNTQQQQQRSTGVNRSGGGNTANNAAANGLPGGAVPGNTPTAAAAAGGVSSAAEEVPIQIVPDSRTNRIFAMGRPVDIVFIEGLIAEFDVKTDERNYLRRKLRFVTVSDFLNIAEPALMRAFSGSSDGSASGASASGANFGGGGSSRSSRNSSSTSASNSRSNFGSSSTGGSGSSFGGGSTGSSMAGGNALDDPDINSAPEARLVGRTLLVADNITNSLLVQGPPASVEIINNLLDEIDVKADQVMISAVFGQLTLTDGFELGIDYLQNLSGKGDFAARGGSGDFPELLLDGTGFDPGSLASSAGLGVYGRFGNNFNVVLSALQTDSNFKVISRPTIFTANNRKGLISSGQRIAIPTSTYNSGTTGTSTNIEYQNVYLTLEVVPLVNSDNEITLEISLVNEEVGENRQIPSGEQVLEIPDILSRQVLTSVTVPNGSTIALGGLISSTLRDSVSGIPLLSDIPGIGRLFSSSSKTEARSELLVFIQPQIVKDSDDLYDLQADNDARYDVAQEARDFSAGPAVIQQAPVVEVQGKNGSGQAVVVPVVEEDASRDRSRRLLGRPGSGFRR
ncbi:type II secretion system protein D [Haloferula luteola]|uniref:Type II secretion system protein D n=1 Tax=Haloferula luteola TaxID=595692 RepID=A0A840VEK2_9BACT|nr:secretin N-terminal domain-containing protein [Haloferula luteola]MBB5352259.1 type II secretion system protein D [Haloferula luteola]